MTTATCSIRKVLIAELDQFRRHRLIECIESWATSKSLEVERIDTRSLAKRQTTASELIYVPLSRNWDFLKDIHPKTPVLVDCDSLPSLGDPILHQKKTAVRQAFGGKIEKYLNLHLPYIHPPSALRRAPHPDVIIVDWRYWLSAPCHLSFLSLLAQLSIDYERLRSRLGRPVYFYFTGFGSPNTYTSAVESLKASLKSALDKQHPGTLPKPLPWDNVLNNTLPPEKELSAFDTILQRGLVFITDNADLADQDIAVAGSIGIPIKICSRNPWKSQEKVTTSLHPALLCIEPAFGIFLDDAQRIILKSGDLVDDIETGLTMSPWNRDLQQSIFEKTLDQALEWANGRSIDPKLQEAFKKTRQPDWW